MQGFFLPLHKQLMFPNWDSSSQPHLSDYQPAPLQRLRAAPMEWENTARVPLLVMVVYDSTQPFMKTLLLMTWVRMAVACLPCFCQVNNDKVEVWEGPDGAGCCLESRTEGFQVADSAF